MADYNIQMKQFNGNDYDNLYPATLASLVRYNQDGGIQSTNVQDALREVNVSRPYIVTGSYVGTGTYGTSNKTSLTFDKPVKFLKVTKLNPNDSSTYHVNGMTWIGQLVYYGIDGSVGSVNSYFNIEVSSDGKTVSWYYSAGGSGAAEFQLNISGVTYLYFAVLESIYTPYVGQTWIITENTTFTVPVTGNYKLELHGGGGGAGGNFTTGSGSSWTTGYDGGAGGGSGEVYNNISLTANTQQYITIGQGGVKGNGGSGSNPATAGQQGGTTSFGSYSIAGGYGGGAATDIGFGAGGAKSGNIATAGSYTYESGVYQPIAGSGGSQYGNYGNGQAYSGGGVSSGSSGAVILTYLGG